MSPQQEHDEKKLKSQLEEIALLTAEIEKRVQRQKTLLDVLTQDVQNLIKAQKVPL